jgi:hypothetical protein
VRVLRSDSRGAHSPDDTSNGQTCVFDGRDDKLIDRDIMPRRSYHYSLFVEGDKGRWSDPICQLVLTYPQAERTAIEATYKGPPPGTLEAESLQRDRPWKLGGPIVGLGDALGGLATDLIFSAASVFAADKAADGWEEIT